MVKFHRQFALNDRKRKTRKQTRESFSGLINKKIRRVAYSTNHDFQRILTKCKIILHLANLFVNVLAEQLRRKKK